MTRDWFARLKRFDLEQLDGTRRLYLLLVGLTFILILPNLLVPLTFDDAVYRLIGASVDRGAILYRDVADQKPPYLLFWYALFHPDTFVGTLLNGVAYSFACAAIPFAVFVSARSLKVKLGSSLWLAMIALVAYRPGPGLDADYLQAAFLCIGYLLLLGNFDADTTARWRRGREIAAGVSFGIAVFMKVAGAFVIFPLTLAYLVLMYRRSIRAFFVSGFCITGSFVIAIAPYFVYALHTGSLPDFWLFVVRYNQLYSTARNVFASWLTFVRYFNGLFHEGNFLLTPLGITAIAAVPVSYRLLGRISAGMRPTGLFQWAAALSFIGGGGVETLMLGGMHDYYWVLPVIGFAMISVWLLVPREIAGGASFDEYAFSFAIAAALLVWLIPANLTSWLRLVTYRDYNVSRAAVARIHEFSEHHPNAEVLVWGARPEILVGEKLRASTRLPGVIQLVRDRTARGTSGDEVYNRFWKEFSSDFMKNPPAMILIVKHDVAELGIGPTSDEARRLRATMVASGVCYKKEFDDATAEMLVRTSAANSASECIEGLRAIANN
jgi:hypothetical protein